MDDYSEDRRQMLDMFLYETGRLLDRLEQIMLDTEKESRFSEENVNEIFRIMHTVKGSSAMMSLENISHAANAVEDLFFFIRGGKPSGLDVSAVSDFVLDVSDFIKGEIGKISRNEQADGDEKPLEQRIKAYLSAIGGDAWKAAVQKPAVGRKPQKIRRAHLGEQRYKARFTFESGTQMANLRAFTIVNRLEEITGELFSDPADLLNADGEKVLNGGVRLFFSSFQPEPSLRAVFEGSMFLKAYTLAPVASYNDEIEKLGLLAAAGSGKANAEAAAVSAEKPAGNPAQHEAGNDLVSVDLDKLDRLMDVVGEIVLTEPAVTSNPAVENCKPMDFDSAAERLRKLTGELRDIVYGIRMQPIASEFRKMRRLVRDMGKRLGREIEFVCEGEETEVDKNIVEHLADPLMHLIRNAVDHGIESAEERAAAGKPEKGRVKLSAVSEDGSLIISVADDGRGLDRRKIYTRARERGLTEKPAEQMSDQEIYSFILFPGFSTNNTVTEYSGRGVGMDVVKRNVEEIGGKVHIQSTEGNGTLIRITVPLTLEVVDVMEIKVGQSHYLLPRSSVREAVHLHDEEIQSGENGMETIDIRGVRHPVLRLHKLFGQPAGVASLKDGIFILIEAEGKIASLFADKIIGEQKVVAKPLPPYLNRFGIGKFGVDRWAVLGDGSVGLVLDAKSLILNIPN